MFHETVVAFKYACEWLNKCLACSSIMSLHKHSFRVCKVLMKAQNDGVQNFTQINMVDDKN